jgi:nitronate monooxygenase
LSTHLEGILSTLKLPLIAAPMTGVSGPDLVIAACREGIAASFPTGNCRTPEELDAWLTQMQSARSAARDAGDPAGALSANIIIRGNARIHTDIETLARHRVDFVITSVGSPVEVVGPLHDAGIAVLADVASMRHAELALEAGVDGLVLLSAGAGGHTGWANGLAFVRAVRSTYAGPVVLAGGISDGVALWASVVLGCDLAYMGTRFIATHESLAGDEWRNKLVEVSLDDIDVAVAPNGVKASFIRGGGGSAGHTVSGVSKLMSVHELIAETAAEFESARERTRALLKS